MLGFGKCIMTLWLGLRLPFCFLLVSPVFYFSLSCFLLHYLNFFKFPFNLPSSSLVMVLHIISWLLPPQGEKKKEQAGWPVYICQ